MAHELHCGDCECNYGENKHNSNCNIFNNFQKTLLDFKSPAEEEKNNNPVFQELNEFGDFDLEMTDDLDEAETMVSLMQSHDISSKQNVLCCCHDNLPHDESMKFMLLTRQNANQRQETVIYPSREKGSLICLNEKQNKNN